MTTTLISGTLTVTITEVLALNDESSNNHGISTTRTMTVAGCTALTRRVVPCPGGTEVGLISLGSSLDVITGTPADTYVAGHFDENTLEYLRVTNLDDTNHATLTVKDSTGAEYAVLLDAGRSWFLALDNTNGAQSVMDADGSALTVSLQNIADITALADTASVDLEVVAVIA